MTLTFNKGAHRYTLDDKPVTGVTTILGVLGKPALIPWAARMTAEWIRENSVVEYEGDAEVPRKWLVTEPDLLEAVKAHTKKKEAGGAKGTDVHSLVEGYIKECLKVNGEALAVVTDDKMLNEFIVWATTNKIKFLASEQQVYSRTLWVAGTFDFSFEKEGKRYLGDLKTMKKMYDRVPFFQTAAYLMMSEEMGEPKYDGTCIVNIAKETNKLTDHWTYDHLNDFEAFKACVTLYRQLANF